MTRLERSCWIAVLRLLTIIVWRMVLGDPYGQSEPMERQHVAAMESATATLDQLKNTPCDEVTS